jgi:Nucleotide modification associated domain 2
MIHLLAHRRMRRQPTETANLRLHSYVIEHDLGFAPNPFFGVCTLACCKPDIRKYAKIGDIVLGTGSAKVGRRGHLSYWMRVDKIITFDDYWADPRFSLKRPVMRGSVMQRHGDNIYHRDAETGAWRWVDSFHSEPDGGYSQSNLNRDTGRTDKVLIGYDFAYWGIKGPKIPDALSDFVVKGQGWKCNFPQDRLAAMQDWLSTLTERGYLGEPADWQRIAL